MTDADHSRSATLSHVPPLAREAPLAACRPAPPRAARHNRRRAAALFVASICCLMPVAAPVQADTGTLHLKDGLTLRGDIRLVEDEAVVQNLIGESRWKANQVDHIDWETPATTTLTEYRRRRFFIPDDATDRRLQLIVWLMEKTALPLARRELEDLRERQPNHAAVRTALEQLAAAEATALPAPEFPGPAERRSNRPVEPPELLSDEAINRMRLAEFDLDDPPRLLDVRFLHAQGQPDLLDLVADELANVPGDPAELEQTLRHGRPAEKLRIILQATGLKHANRIEVRGDPPAFATFRRRVLPLALNGCSATGCHGGQQAYDFRFPVGARTTSKFVYTSFLILDQLQTPLGPMIDRGLPENSALLKYMLPGPDGQVPHPKNTHRPVRPILRNTRDPRYAAIIEWIDSLRVPRPDYGINYTLPDWLDPLRYQRRALPATHKPEDQPAPEPGRPQPTTAPATTQPAP